MLNFSYKYTSLIQNKFSLSSKITCQCFDVFLQKRSRTRSRSRSRDRRDSRTRRDSPPRKRPVIHQASPPRYMVRVPKIPLDM